MVGTSVLGGLSFTIAAYLFLSAQDSYQREKQAYALVDSLSQSIREFKSAVPEIRAETQEGDSDFLSSIIETSKGCEIPDQAIEDVRMVTPLPIINSSFAREDTIIQFKKITMSQLLAFLSAIETKLPHCNCSSLELAAANSTQSDDNVTWRAKVTLTQTTRLGTSPKKR
jgi:hypothetical protein